MSIDRGEFFRGKPVENTASWGKAQILSNDKRIQKANLEKMAL